MLILNEITNMIDPLDPFDFRAIYEQYDRLAPRYNESIIMLGLDPKKIKNDRALYYHLRNKFSVKQNISMDDYIHLLFWKLNTSGNSTWRKLLTEEDRKKREATSLNAVIRSLPDSLNKNVKEINNFLKRIYFCLYGMRYETKDRAKAAWPTRSTFLHFIYPDIIPIFDKMVLKAVDPDYEDGDNKKLDKFLQYIPHVWKLAQKYKDKIKNIPNLRDTDVRIIEMALWITRDGQNKLKNECRHVGYKQDEH
ncbi:MAG: hypothetical protein WCS88_05235 [Patescibacteria group bacterium]|jgi:hypothetical protein